ncbi:MAG: MFS transporter [Gordonia sp. (in: high G+C Gram-positive bacteria)]|uniref:MFS transporter n=1 Tax=Gordonia sp. (in: high G+C Gram-positive bacteria) TaxID=84139 RepID=UPI0039E58186
MPTTPGRSPAVIIAVLCAAGIAVSLMQTIIVPLIPWLPQYLHSSGDNTAWALTATLLTGAVSTPISGRLGDMYGKRLIMVLCLAAVVVGSVVCAMTEQLTPFLIGRALEGFGMGAIALGISMMRDTLPPERLGSGIAAMSSSLGVGGALGLPIAAVIAQAHWHALFWGAGAITLACLVAILLVMPPSPTQRSAGFDYLGALGLAAALTLLLLPLSKGATWGWTTPLTLGLFAAAVIVFALWAAYEWRRDDPLVDLRTTAQRTVALTNAASLATGFALFSMSIIPVQLLMAPALTGNGNGLSMVKAGLFLAPGGLVMFAFSNVGARIIRLFGGRRSLTIGAAVMGLGYLFLLVMLIADWHIGPWHLVAITSIISAGIGMAYAAMPSLIMGAVPLRQTGEANGVNALMRSLGMSSASAIVGMVLATYVIVLQLPSERGGTEPHAFPSNTGYLIATIISLIACVIAVVCASMLRGEVEPVD